MQRDGELLLKLETEYCLCDVYRTRKVNTLCALYLKLGAAESSIQEQQNKKPAKSIV